MISHLENIKLQWNMNCISPSDRLLPIWNCEITWTKTRRWPFSVAKSLDTWWEFTWIHQPQVILGWIGTGCLSKSNSCTKHHYRQGTALRMASTKGSVDAVYLWWFMMMSSICFLRSALLSRDHVTSRLWHDLSRSLWLLQFANWNMVHLWWFTCKKCSFSIATFHYQMVFLFLEEISDQSD